MSEQNMWLICGVIFFAAFTASLLIWFYTRHKFVHFTEQICASLDQILRGTGENEFQLEEDLLDSKVQWKLQQLVDITAAVTNDNTRQKEQVQSIVSDISHQLKTPVSNIVMYCDTALNPQLSKEQQEKCLGVMRRQVEKLDFLVEMLVKMSRLENNLIILKKERANLHVALEEAVDCIVLKAAQKEICIKLDCPEEIWLPFDPKWIAEAFFNVLDNAVKYTEAGGKISILVEAMEIYTKVVISDNGIGIPEAHLNDVCKRFYRGANVKMQEGVGIGLYLTREIMRRQSGYMKIVSKEQKGTAVSLYLLNDKKEMLGM